MAGGAVGRGSVYRVTTTGQFQESLGSFAGRAGASPSGGVIRASGRQLYGTTASGGPANRGTVFRLSRDGTLSSFAGSRAMTVRLRVRAFSRPRTGFSMASRARGSPRPRDGVRHDARGSVPDAPPLHQDRELRCLWHLVLDTGPRRPSLRDHRRCAHHPAGSRVPAHALRRFHRPGHDPGRGGSPRRGDGREPVRDDLSAAVLLGAPGFRVPPDARGRRHDRGRVPLRPSHGTLP